MKKTRIEVEVALCDLNTGQLDWLPTNPRQWSEDALTRTMESLTEDPDWLEDRPLNVVPYVADGERRFVVFCGNLRTTACRELGRPTAPAYLYEPENETDRETVRRRAIKDNGTFGWWDADTLSGWNVEPPQLLAWGVPDWVMGGAGTGTAENGGKNGDGEGQPPVGPDGYGESFQLPSGKKSNYEEITFQVSAVQAVDIRSALKAAQELEEFKKTDATENANRNGRALTLIVKQWEEQRKS